MTQTDPSRRRRQRWHSHRARGETAARAAPAIALRRRPMVLMTLLAALASGCGERRQTASAPDGKASDGKVNSRISGDQESFRNLRQAAQNLEDHPAPLSAKIRQAVNVLDHEMVGSGEYCQMPNPADDGMVRLLSRMDLRLQVHERTAIWKQLCDGKFIWTDRKVPDDDKTAARTDGELGYNMQLERVALEEVAQANILPREDGRFTVASLCGLPQLLRTLAGSFDFAPPRIVQFGRGTVWLLEGRWNAAVLSELLPAGTIRPGEIDLGSLPGRMPDRVKVYLGKDRTGPWLGDLSALRVSPPDLFPFRIEYARQSESGEVKDVLSLEVFDVVLDDEKLRPERFTFQTKRKPKNGTPRFLQAASRALPQGMER